jgi:hypothetical protein
MTCQEIIGEIYSDKRFIDLIGKTNPVELQDELRQEVALVLLNYNCIKIKSLYKKNELFKFVAGVVWTIGFKKNHKYYKTFKKKYDNKLEEYFRSKEGKEIPDSAIQIAIKILNDKLNKNANEAHESMIFEKYVELRNLQKVADYYNIPHIHVFNVVKKTREELKKAINNNE